jgi:hypothetical protein
MAWPFAGLVLHGIVLGVATLMMAKMKCIWGLGLHGFRVVCMHTSLIFFVSGPARRDNVPLGSGPFL